MHITRLNSNSVKQKWNCLSEKRSMNRKSRSLLQRQNIRAVLVECGRILSAGGLTGLHWKHAADSGTGREKSLI
jgi:hypothetical protein